MKAIHSGIYAVVALLFSTALFAHGDVLPQGVNVEGLPKVESVLEENPYRGVDEAVHAKAVGIGASAYNQNCARCHGLGGVSGGIAPDLRYLPAGKFGDEYYAQKVRNGVVRNEVTYMPPFGDIFSEEAIWAVRSYLDAIHTD